MRSGGVDEDVSIEECMSPPVAWLFGVTRFSDAFFVFFLLVLPRHAIQKMPKDTLVLNLPMAPAQDPSQNFLALFHEKRINAGYLSYTTYTFKAVQPFIDDPLLGKISCGSDNLKYEATAFMQDLSQVRKRLIDLKA